MTLPKIACLLPISNFPDRGFQYVQRRRYGPYSLFYHDPDVDWGRSGSTAGGIKVNTFSMIIATIWDTIRGENIQALSVGNFSFSRSSGHDLLVLSRE
jgi:hypothetical protein